MSLYVKPWPWMWLAKLERWALRGWVDVPLPRKLEWWETYPLEPPVLCLDCSRRFLRSALRRHGGHICRYQWQAYVPEFEGTASTRPTISAAV